MIVVVGLSHRSAPIEVRERLALPREEVTAVLRELMDHPAVAEVMVLSTCNRVEVVAAGTEPRGADLSAVADAAVAALEARAPGISAHAYRHLGADAVQHLFRVASSLDSLVLGEPQILGQLKQSFELARETGTVGIRLNRTIPRAIRAAKRVRTETSVGSGQVSVPSVAVDLATQIFGELRGRTAALVGAGEMAETVARLLVAENVRLLVVGRDPVKVAELTDRIGGEPRGFDQLQPALQAADVVITSTSAPTYVVPHELVAAGHRARRGRSLFFIDLAVPRDVDPRVSDLDRVFAYNIDDFSRVVEETFSQRRREAEQAEQIVQSEAEGFDRWLGATEQVTPAIVALRSKFESVLVEELDRTLRSRLKHLSDEDRVALEKMREAAVNKLLHSATVNLRQVAQENLEDGMRTEQMVEALTALFEIDCEVPASVPRPSAPDQVAADDVSQTNHNANGKASA